MNIKNTFHNINIETTKVNHLPKEELLYITCSVIKSEHAVKYLTVLCRHFSRKVKAEWTDFQGVVYFDVGMTKMTVNSQEDELHFECKAASEHALEQQKAIINHHIALFARRESIELLWS